jgi:hypothetical protein
LLPGIEIKVYASGLCEGQKSAPFSAPDVHNSCLLELTCPVMVSDEKIHAIRDHYGDKFAIDGDEVGLLVRRISTGIGKRIPSEGKGATDRRIKCIAILFEVVTNTRWRCSNREVPFVTAERFLKSAEGKAWSTTVPDLPNFSSMG